MVNKKEDKIEDKIEAKVKYSKYCPSPQCFHSPADHPLDGPCKAQDCRCQGGWGFVVKKEK